MKILFTTLLLTLFLSVCYSQQPAQYSMYMLNKYAFNPAYAGMDNSLSLTGTYRSQWVGLDGAPETQSLNAHMPLYFAGGGIGIGIEGETIGSWKQTMTTIGYDYQMLVNNAGVLSLGLNVGLLQRELDGSKVRTPGGIYGESGSVIDHEDALLLAELQNGVAPTVHIGTFYQGERLEVGLSAMNLLENEVSLSEFGYKTDRTLFLYLGYQLDLSNKLTVSPSALLKTSTEQTQVDLSVLIRYNENIFFGTSFRGYNSKTRDAVALMGGFKLNERITLGYNYDISISNIKAVSSGTHEILLNYNLGKEIGKGRPPQIIYNPRSL